MFGVYVLFGFGGSPRYIWYSVQADFEVDGETVSVGGTVQCERNSFYQYVLSELDLPLGSSGLNYNASQGAFARRLETGGALIVKLSQCLLGSKCKRAQGYISRRLYSKHYLD